MPIAETAETKRSKRDRKHRAKLRQASKLSHKRFVRKLKVERYYQRKGQAGLLLTLSTLIERE